MAKGSRLSAEERRESILKASIPLFAKFGFKGTTTKQIAKAANVSEALLYRHFPGKEAIYDALKNYCCHHKKEAIEKIRSLKASTSTLIHCVHYLVIAIATGQDEHHQADVLSHTDMHRLMAHSYLEDGEFASMFMNENIELWVSFLNECVHAARDAGDMLEDWISPNTGLWLAHHIGVSLGLLNLPENQVIPYEVSAETRIQEAVLFALRGVGLKDEVIRAHYNPSALNALFGAPDKKLNDEN